MDLPPTPSADRFEDLPPGEQEAVQRAAREMHLIVYRHALPVTIGNRDGGTLNSGSASVVFIKDRAFVLTARHVLDKFYERYASETDLVVQVGQMVLDLDARPVWMSPNPVDLALVSLSSDEAAKLG